MGAPSKTLRRRSFGAVSVAGRAGLAGRLIGMAAVMQVCAALLAPSSMAAPASTEITCEPNDVCRIVKTRLPLRVLPRVNSNIYQAKDPDSPVVEANVPAFVPLFVFERTDVSYADPIRPSGWFRVGKSRDKAIGYMRAADALEWKSAVVVSYAHRGVGENERKPVIMFKDNAPLRGLVLDPKLTERAENYYARLAGKNVPDEVITREPDTYVDIKKKFYLLPVLESIDLSDQGIDDAHILQIAAAVPNARAKVEDLCTTERKDFAECSKKFGMVTDDDLKIDVVYVIDFTESMQPYINAVTKAMRDSALHFTRAAPKDRVRFGLIGFRDHPDSDPDNEFVARNFTPDLVSYDSFVDIILKQGKAKGGGDLQEEMYRGVLEGLNARWNDNTTKVLFLIGDASSHDTTHKFATTDKDARALRLLATEQSVFVGSVYIKNSRQSIDWQRGQEQFKEISTNPGPGGASFKAVDEKPDEVTTAILVATAEMVDRIKSMRPSKKPAASGEFNPFSDAFRLSLVEFIGRATEPPKDITAWVLDKDLTNLARRSFDIHVLVTRKDLDELTDGLQKLIEAYEGNKLTNEGFFKTLQAMTTLRGLDGGDVSKATILAKTQLLPRWIDALPYKSEITNMTFSDFEEQSADKAQQLQAKLRSLVTTYRAIQERQDSWVKLNEVARYEDYVYPLLLDNLP
jgi:hypothetical protein